MARSALSINILLAKFTFENLWCTHTYIQLLIYTAAIPIYAIQSNYKKLPDKKLPLSRSLTRTRIKQLASYLATYWWRKKNYILTVP